MAHDRQKLCDRVSDWTARYVVQQRRLSWIGCAGCALASLPVFFLTYWVIYAVLAIGFQGLLTTPTARMVGSGCVVLLLIPAYVTANWNELRSIKFESSDRLLAARLVARASGFGGFALLAGPHTAHAFVKVLSATLLLGPGLIHWAIRLAGRASLLDKLNAAAVSETLTALVERHERISLDELAKQSNSDPDQLVIDLALVSGVVPLRSGEPGYTLTDELRQDLMQHRAFSSSARHAGE